LVPVYGAVRRFGCVRVDAGKFERFRVYGHDVMATSPQGDGVIRRDRVEIVTGRMAVLREVRLVVPLADDPRARLRVGRPLPDGGQDVFDRFYGAAGDVDLGQCN